MFALLYEKKNLKGCFSNSYAYRRHGCSSLHVHHFFPSDVAFQRSSGKDAVAADCSVATTETALISLSPAVQMLKVHKACHQACLGLFALGVKTQWRTP